MRDSKKEKKKEIGEREVEKGDIDDIEREREREKRRVRQTEMREIKKVIYYCCWFMTRAKGR